MKLREHDFKEIKGYYTLRFKRDAGNFIKWILLGALCGFVIGGASSAFSYVLALVTEVRELYPYIVLGLPVGGIIILFLYERFDKSDGGTNQVLSTIRFEDDIPFRAAPLIFISTAITHLFGGSAGREGAAIQLGGSIGNKMGKILKLDDNDVKVMVMAGMSAAFSALFGTPMAAAVFSMEVVSVGTMYYAALLPCVTASLIASKFAAGLGIHPEVFMVTEIPELTFVTAGKMAIIAIICAVVSIIFCILLSQVGGLSKKYIVNKYARIVVMSLIFIVVVVILRTDIYMGAGTEIIARAIGSGETGYFTFFWKMILTVLIMRAGFRGGEIVPTFAIGASLGCFMGQVFGLSPSLCAASGMVALFAGVTNCPITSILIAFELFGFGGVSYYLIAVAIGYALSGYYSLYKDQRIVYSKYKTTYVNKNTR